MRYEQRRMADSEANLVKHLIKDGGRDGEQIEIESNLGGKSRRRWSETERLDEEHWKTILLLLFPRSVFLYYIPTKYNLFEES